jgi:plasmid stabilization system protein ParE
MAPRKYRLRWSDAAAADLRDIWDYYAEVASRNVAARVLSRIGEAGKKGCAGAPVA